MTTTTAPGTRAFQASDLAYVAVFAALIAALSLVPAIPVGGLGVPITLQTLAVSLAALILGPWKGAAAVLLYLVVGFAGLPVFAQGKSGIGVLFGPSGGYLVAFVFYTIAVGLVVRALTRKGLTALTPVWMFLTLIAFRLLITYPLGTLGMMRALGKSFGEMYATDFVFWPGDAIKSVFAVAIAYAVFKAFPRLLNR